MKKHTTILSLLLTLAMVVLPSFSFEHEEILTTTSETPGEAQVKKHNRKNEIMSSSNEQGGQKNKCNNKDDDNSILIPPPNTPLDTTRILNNLEQQQVEESKVVSSSKETKPTCISINRGNDGVIADMNISGICSCPDINYAMESIFCRDTMDRTQLICKVSTRKKQQGATSDNTSNDTSSCDTNLMLSIDNVDKEDAELMLGNEARMEAILMQQSSHEFGKVKNGESCMDDSSSTEIGMRSVKFHVHYIGFQSP